MTYWHGLIVGGIGFLVASVLLEKLPKESAWRVPAIFLLGIGGPLALVSGARLAGKHSLALILLLATLCVSFALVSLWKARDRIS